MNHWIRHTDLSSWNKFASVVFLISRIALLRCCLERIDGRRGHRTGITLGTSRAYILLQSQNSTTTEEVLYIHFLLPNPNPEALWSLLKREARLQGSDSISIFPNFDPYTTMIRACLENGLSLRLLCSKHQETCSESTFLTHPLISATNKVVFPNCKFTRYI